MRSEGMSRTNEAESSFPEIMLAVGSFSDSESDLAKLLLAAFATVANESIMG
jgi:hypothetical protein